MPNPARLKVLARARALSIDMHRAFQNVHVRVNPELKSQLLRSVASTARNISEGSGQPTVPQFIRFIDYAIGSANETEECLAQIAALSLLPSSAERRWSQEIADVRMTLYGLRRYLERKREATEPNPDADPAGDTCL